MTQMQEESENELIDPTTLSLKKWSDYVSLQLILKSRWASRSNCYELFPHRMYPSTEASQKEVASSICADCPTKKQCLLLSVMLRETCGVWGGTTESERSELFRVTDGVFDPKDFTDPSCIEPLIDTIDSYLEYQSNMSTSKNFELVQVKEI